MRLDEFLETDLTDDRAEQRRLAQAKSYRITEYIEDVPDWFEAL